MQFVKDGPDIPDTLLQAHEDGNVIFFCGAGISYPAGLMGFDGLVDKIYKSIGETKTELESEVYERGQYDSTLDLLERRVAGQRAVVRRALWKSLKPNFRLKNATRTHESLLKLASDKNDKLRIVTTNVDRIFERAAKKQKQKLNSFVAPMLPIPKKSRWDGIVYLHGLLPENEEQSEFNRLVFTSGDFGLAYLNERWASRFVSELFKNYVICFVGYSINDPVLRYMMDALAADRMQGESFPDAFALGDCTQENKNKKTKEWMAKGVIPILYNLETDIHDHSKLHDTLKVWADTYTEGASGKESIITKYALSQPSQSTVDDDYVGRVIWALSDPSGLPAKRFAEFNPCPSITWLKAFSEKRFTKKDLSRFGILTECSEANDIQFSLIDRPRPVHLSSWMSVRENSYSTNNWDNVIQRLAQWMTRHLNDPQLVFWLTSYSGKLSPHFIRLVESKLDRYKTLKTNELEKIRLDSPSAIPCESMRILWRMLLTNRVTNHSHNTDLYRWIDRLKHEDLTASLVIELREILAPKIHISKPFHFDVSEVPKPYDWEIVLEGGNVKHHLPEIKITLGNNLGLLFDDFQMLLLDALNLYKEMGNTDEHSDRSYWDLPSICEHFQNRGFHDWVTLIEVLRDSWLQILSTNPKEAHSRAIIWFDKPFPTFKRLALFAASHDSVIEPRMWCEWLCRDNGWWLWSTNTQREVMRLLVLQGNKLKQRNLFKLEETILRGLPREMFRPDINEQNFQRMCEHSIWLHLAKLEQGKVKLSSDTKDKYNELCIKHPEWHLSENDKDEFSHWMSGSGDPDFESSREMTMAPSNRHELSEWLLEPIPSNHFDYEDNWRDVCRQHFDLSFGALSDLFLKNLFPVDRWKTALRTWREGDAIFRSWGALAPTLVQINDSNFKDVIHPIAHWLEAVSKQLTEHYDLFISLINRILMVYVDKRDEVDQVTITSAINNPIGIATEALINYWFTTKPKDNDRLQKDFFQILDLICTEESRKFDHGKLIVASQTIALYRVDRQWSERSLLPLFNWINDERMAAIMWKGFLWSPRIYFPLLGELKESLLDTALHLEKIDDSRRQYIQLFTYIILEPNTIFTASEIQTILSQLSIESLEEVTIALTQALEGAADKKEEYWRKRILPLWQTSWPKSSSYTSMRIVESLVRLIINTGKEFPNALSLVQSFLFPIKHSDYSIRQLEKTGLSTDFPESALELIDKILDVNSYPPSKLRICLDSISSSCPRLEKTNKFKRLNDFLRKHNK